MVSGRWVFALSSVLVAMLAGACTNGGGSRSTAGTGSTPIDGGGQATTSSGSPGTTSATMTSQMFTTTYGGLNRSYILDIPTSYDKTKSYPLVMVFHGNPGSASEMHQDHPFDAASHEEAIVVYPNGQNGQWDLYTPGSANIDMEFVRSLIGTIGATVNIDTSRVYAFGFSGGAFFTAQLACRYGGVFAAIGIHSGGGPDEPQEANAARYANGCIQCAGGPVPTFVVHGDADQTVPVSSGQYVANCFATVNGCDTTTTSMASAEPSPCQSYSCGSSDAVDLCIIPGLDHAMWDQARAGAWAFFKAH